jgi:uncharacterized damage-inducible protein DinB
MSQIGSLVKEMEEQALITKKFMELVPQDKFEWQPHPKSMTLGKLASHVAELAGWASMVVTTDELDFAANPYTAEPIKTNADLMRYFEENFEKGHTDLMNADESVLDENWTLRNGDTIYSTEPKRDVIRMSYNQIVHHRAQLGVYFRLLDIPVPQSFGPTADNADF